MQWKRGARISLIAGAGLISACAAHEPNRLKSGGILSSATAAADEVRLDIKRVPAPTPPTPDTGAASATFSLPYDAVMRLSWGDTATLPPTTRTADAIWVQHPNLPIPSYVELTRLDNGKTILAEVVGRTSPGLPYVGALSKGAARLLGLNEDGAANVRVRRVNPTASDRDALSSGRSAAARLDTPDFLLSILRQQARELPTLGTASPRKPVAAKSPTKDDAKAKISNPQENIAAISAAVHQKRPEQSQPLTAVSGTNEKGWYIQLAALSSARQAQILAQMMRGQISPAGSLHRVRVGPYASVEAARAALGPIRAKGYPDARITR